MREGKNESAHVAGDDECFVMAAQGNIEQNNDELWFADNCCTSALTNSKEALYDVRAGTSIDRIKVGNGKYVQPKLVGKLRGSIADKDGEDVGNVTLNKVCYLDDTVGNFVPLGHMIKDGWQLSQSAEKLKAKNEVGEIVFDIPIEVGDGVMHAMRIKRNDPVEAVKQEEQAVKLEAMVKVNGTKDGTRGRGAIAKDGNVDEEESGNDASVGNVEGVKLTVNQASDHGESTTKTRGAKAALSQTRLMKSVGLKDKLPMVYEDNKGAFDQASNWSIAGKTRHMDVRYATVFVGGDKC